MFALNKLFSQTKIPLLCRLLGTVYEKELTVIPFCNLNVNVPFNINITPLDVHKYRDCNKIIVRLISDENLVPNVQCDHSMDTVSIYSPKASPTVTCEIQAPVKASITAESTNGDIRLSGFNCDSINLETVHGDIAASKCYCDKISISSTTGNLTLSNVMQAGEVYLKTGKAGFITTGRLQGLVLIASTEAGFIKTESSYCNSSSFLTQTGSLELSNVHKKCSVAISKKGDLNMIGFDGGLHAFVKEGTANIQVSRIDDESEVRIEKGALNLKLSEECTRNTCLRVLAKSLHIDKSLKFNENEKDEYRALNFSEEDGCRMLLDCKNGNVAIESASWIDMFNKKFSV